MRAPVAGPVASCAAGPAPAGGGGHGRHDHPLEEAAARAGGTAVRFAATLELSKDEVFRLCDVTARCERALRARGWHALAASVGAWTDTLEARLCDGAAC